MSVREIHEAMPVVLDQIVSAGMDVVAYATTSILPHVKSGDLRAVVTFTKKRDELYPDTPTVAELNKVELAALGVPRLVAGPPKMPAGRVKVLVKALEKTLKDPELLAWSKKAKRPIEPISAEEAKQLQVEIMQTYTGYSKVLKDYF